MSRSGLWAQAPFPVDAMQHNSAAADRNCALNPQACQLAETFIIATVTAGHSNQ